MQARIYDTTSISFPVPNPCFLHAAYVIIHEERLLGRSADFFILIIVYHRTKVIG